MNTAIKPDLKSKTFCSSKSYSPLRKKEIGLADYKSYQKLFIVFISLSIFLIFPESPKELDNICVNNNSSQICNVW